MSFTSGRLPLRVSQPTVVEGDTIRIFPADYPICKLFKPLPFEHISSLRFGITTLRVFQHIRRNTLQGFPIQRTEDINPNFSSFPPNTIKVFTTLCNWTEIHSLTISMLSISISKSDKAKLNCFNSSSLSDKSYSHFRCFAIAVIKYP